MAALARIALLVSLVMSGLLRGVASTPLLLPLGDVENLVRSDDYAGLTEVGENHIATLILTERADGAVEKGIRVFLREGMETLGVIVPLDLQEAKTYTWQLLIFGGKLGVTAREPESYALLMAVFDLETPGLPLLFTREFPSEPWLSQMSAAGGLWLIGGLDIVIGTDLESGVNVGQWSAPIGRILDGGWMLSQIPSGTWDGVDEFFLADLRQPGVVLNLRGIPSIEPGYREFYVTVCEAIVILQAIYPETEDGPREIITAYHPASGSVVWQREDPPGDWYQAPAFGNRLMVHDGNDGLHVYDLWTGELKTTLHAPTGQDGWFGYTIGKGAGMFFISGLGTWHAYDEQSLEFLYALDTGGHKLTRAMIAEIPGSELLAWVYNLEDYSGGGILNADYWNPQVLLFDPAEAGFTHQLDPGNAAVRSLDYGVASPEKFGLRLYASKRGRIALSLPELSLLGDTLYQEFDPVLRVDDLVVGATRALRYVETTGYAIDLIGEEEDGNKGMLRQSPWGEGGHVRYDIPFSVLGSGDRYWLHRKEVTHVVRDYTTGSASFEEPVEGVFSEREVIVPSADAVIVCDWDTRSTGGKGSVYVLNLDDGSLRFAIGPYYSRFGARLSVAGNRVAIGGVGAPSQEMLRVADLDTGVILQSFTGADAFSLSEDILVRIIGDEMVGNRVSNGEELYRVPVSYELPYPSARPEILAGSNSVIFEGQVYDLETGTSRFEIVSPNPEPADHFGSHWAVDGNWIVAVSAPQATAYGFDATTGTHLLTLSLPEHSGGYANYVSPYPRLALDAAMGVLAWSVGDPISKPVVNLFDLNSGLRFAQVRAPLTTTTWYDTDPLQPPMEVETPREGIGEGIALTAGKLWLRIKRFDSSGGRAFASYAYEGVRYEPMDESLVEIIPDQALNLSWDSRRDVVYQAIGGGDLNGMLPVGDSFRGTGAPLTLPLWAEGEPASWFARLQLDWLDADGIRPTSQKDSER